MPCATWSVIRVGSLLGSVKPGFIPVPECLPPTACLLRAFLIEGINAPVTLRSHCVILSRNSEGAHTLT